MSGPPSFAIPERQHEKTEDARAGVQNSIEYFAGPDRRRWTIIRCCGHKQKSAQRDVPAPPEAGIFSYAAANRHVFRRLTPD
jgi:hypothetical protein